MMQILSSRVNYKFRHGAERFEHNECGLGILFSFFENLLGKEEYFLCGTINAKGVRGNWNS